MIENRNDNEVQYDEELLRQLLLDGNIEEFREHYLALHPYDQAQFYEKVGPDIRKIIFLFLSPQELALIFEALEIDNSEYEEYLKEMETSYAAEMLSVMDTDDAVDVLNELDEEHRDSFLEMMDSETVEEFHELLAYEEYTAGAIMTTEYVSILQNSTVRSAMNVLRNEAPNAETIYYVFVVDDQHRLTGVISLRDLIVSSEDTLIKDIMSDRVVYANVTADQEDVAQIFKDYDFLAVPVVDENNELVGIITVDDIIDVIDEEASDDYSKLAGISDVDDVNVNPFKAASKRLPWLIILLFLGMITATLMGQFEATLDKVAILALFIPLISGTSGNSGTQALAVAVRGIATGEIDGKNKLKLLFREISTGLITGIICALVVIGIIFFWKHSLIIGLLVGAAICCSIVVATIAGSFIPLLIHKMGIDPAVASGPFITTLNDITSILIYLGLASMLIGQLG
ncbi:magnesium transporter MgtE [Ureibacillus massiliensis 4400831 = CIP 108448 = CCUG 49529]|uniref:Magnesium transporter MgtE n=1 Tax=Ureibacillus massiliensis 4400831 = CIP 108448 = CCUG 49529 TaxID=1211035 RepID=A0A0A3J0T7_9BACL|nr:magnesium transporter [Ureibacillus massiliensis]KGR90581.1 magnesium transporter MgtE [Ureibacillus massiliensis 4400831 = CIP 108448 = CCUG 49529]